MPTQRSPHTPSSIPTRSTKLPTARRPSFTTPGPSSPSVSGFRALRSLLPFGPNKHSTPVSPSVSPNPNGSRFASFSAVRKSINRDRNASLSSSDLPVMLIDQAPADDSADFPVRKSISLYNEKPSSSQPDYPTVVLPDLPTAPEETAPVPLTVADKQSSETLKEEPPPVFSPPFRTPSPLPELSTIIEAEISGISKYLPSASPSPSPTSPSHPSQDPLPADEVSTLDLSTTHLNSQVMDAMMAQENPASKAWLDTSDEPGPKSDLGDVSFNLGALDPDLAALLSPNRMVPSDTNHTIRAGKSSVDLGNSPLLSPTSSGSLRPQHQSSRPRLRPVQRPSTPPDANTRRSPSVSSSAGHSQTMRRAPPSPLSLSHPPSPVLSSAAIPPSPLLSNTSPVSSTPASVRRTHHQPAASVSTPQLNSRRPMLSRMLQSDSWESTPSSSRSRPSLDSAGYRPSSASDSRTSLDTNRHRPSLDTNRQTNSTNAGTVRERPSESSTAWNTKLRRRKRSMSVDEQRTSPSGYSPYGESRPGSSMSSRPEWLGPRTAKAFKAAGLLGSPESADGSEGLSPPTSGRAKFGFGSSRSSSTVGRSDSRAGVTSPAPGRRRGSGSGSYFGSAGSQLMESPTLTMSSRDTPRSASTAPTSVSGASWGRDGEEIRELKDKHAVETGALLSALSDSQRTSKVLREENSELRERLARLEADAERTVALERENQALREFVTELREEAGQLKLQLRLAAPVASSSRYLAPATTQPFRLGHRGGESPRSGDEEVSEDSYNPAASAFASTPASSKHQRRRLSSSSSIFPAPPSNMSLLLHEEGANSSDYDERSGASGSRLASPTMVLPRIDASPERAHRANKSITSVASMATTSPNASMLGSPRSLLLRPEHEVHLGDMDSLDLGRAGPDEEDWSE
ncbi:hypothetical protein DFH07DRAFT_935147 [Mycena maculata]|uniref:Uncharacterized protein n=1 Tax=Mycena maculata TaxID=230809 RepID=A0AAD7P0K4_9AGAR|nr:hypothetical protein DFH07DRAFT_935147 [Mycena maculata]